MMWRLEQADEFDIRMRLADERASADLIPPTGKTYSGPLEVGEDLMLIEVGDTITVRRPAAPSR